MPSRAFAAVCTLALAASTLAASNLDDDAGRIRRSNQVFQEVMKTPDKGIPQEVLEGAQCIAIVPSEKNFALGFGGTYGKGLATCRNGDSWSAPIFIQVGGGSWGLQLGGQSTDVIMVFRTRDGLDHLLGDKVRIGADANAAAGPVGRQASAATDASMHAEILTYSRSRGAFAGISLDGDVVQPDKSGNSAMYGEKSWKSILGGDVAPTSAARPLLRTLDHYSAHASK
ncbi:MAG TPA: lipid-binding SYLF domain-containing protein [Tepidisphaeraceae bacterium]|nr:lipid-binding SYLF domain-containing protein [Tepidisphaeraceae bacterium]